MELTENGLKHCKNDCTNLLIMKKMRGEMIDWSFVVTEDLISEWWYSGYKKCLWNCGIIFKLSKVVFPLGIDNSDLLPQF